MAGDKVGQRGPLFTQAGAGSWVPHILQAVRRQRGNRRNANHENGDLTEGVGMRALRVPGQVGPSTETDR